MYRITLLIFACIHESQKKKTTIIIATRTDGLMIVRKINYTSDLCHLSMMVHSTFHIQVFVSLRVLSMFMIDFSEDIQRVNKQSAQCHGTQPYL